MPIQDFGEGVLPHLTQGIGMNRCDDRTITSTGWFVFPNMAMEAIPERESFPRANVPDSQYVFSVVTTSLGIFWRSATSSKPMASQIPTNPILPLAMLKNRLATVVGPVSRMVYGDNSW